MKVLTPDGANWSGSHGCYSLFFLRVSGSSCTHTHILPSFLGYLLISFEDLWVSRSSRNDRPFLGHFFSISFQSFDAAMCLSFFSQDVVAGGNVTKVKWRKKIVRKALPQKDVSFCVRSRKGRRRRNNPRDRALFWTKWPRGSAERLVFEIMPNPRDPRAGMPQKRIHLKEELGTKRSRSLKGWRKVGWEMWRGTILGHELLSDVVLLVFDGFCEMVSDWWDEILFSGDGVQLNYFWPIVEDVLRSRRFELEGCLRCKQFVIRYWSWSDSNIGIIFYSIQL